MGVIIVMRPIYIVGPQSVPEIGEAKHFNFDVYIDKDGRILANA